MTALVAHLPQLLVALGAGLVLVMYLTARPGAYAVLWLVGICFVPWWVGTKVQTFLPVAVILSVIGLLCLTPAVPRRITLPDLGVLCFLAACFLPVVVGGSIKSGTFGAGVFWLPAYLVGRRLPGRVDLRRIYDLVAVLFSIVALLAIIEFVFSWNPFIRIHFGSASCVRDLGHPADAWRRPARGGRLRRLHRIRGLACARDPDDARQPATPVAPGLRGGADARRDRRDLQQDGDDLRRLGCRLLCHLPWRGYDTPTPDRPCVGDRCHGGHPVPLINSTFTAAGTEATQSADYRGALTSVLPHLNVVGISDLATRLPDGTLYFGSFRSIDSQLVLTGLTYGAFALIVACVMLVASIVTVLSRRATAPTIALACQIPALATIALITQYAVLFWFLVGLSIASQAARGENREVDTTRDSRAACTRCGF